MRLAVEALGVFSPVGLNVPQTMGSLRTRLALFTELPLFGTDGEPLVAAPAPLQAGLASAWTRQVAMGAFALAECAVGAPEEPLPLVLCTTEPEEDTFQALLTRLSREARVPLDRKLSLQVPGGHAAVGLALQQAHALLSTGKADACYVGATDSLLELRRLRRLSAAGRIKGENSLDAFIPGEAAAFLRVSLRPSSGGALAWVTGVSCTSEERSFRSGRPSTARGLTAAVREALAQAGLQSDDVALVGQDLTGERYFFTEWALAATRLKFRRPHQLPTWTAALSVGEVGAALGPLTLAYFCFLLGTGGLASLQEDGVARRALLYGAASDEALRTAVLLQEARRG